MTVSERPPAAVTDRPVPSAIEHILPTEAGETAGDLLRCLLAQQPGGVGRWQFSQRLVQQLIHRDAIVARLGSARLGSTSRASIRSECPPGHAGTFGTYIASGYFSLVALNFTDTTALDHEITVGLCRNHHYRIIEVVPYGTEVVPYGLGTYIIWEYQPRQMRST